MSIGINTNTANIIASIADVTLAEGEVRTVSVTATDLDVADLESPRSNSSVKANESILTTNYLAAQLNAQLNARRFAPTLESQEGVYNVSVTATDDLGLSASTSFLTTASSEGAIDGTESLGNKKPKKIDLSNQEGHYQGDINPVNDDKNEPSQSFDQNLVAGGSTGASVASNPLYANPGSTGNNPLSQRQVGNDSFFVNETGVITHTGNPDTATAHTEDPIQ